MSGTEPHQAPEPDKVLRTFEHLFPEWRVSIDQDGRWRARRVIPVAERLAEQLGGRAVDELSGTCAPDLSVQLIEQEDLVRAALRRTL